MKRIYIFLILQYLILNISPSFGQAGTWTWVSGSDLSGSIGTYGTQGIPSANNHPPGVYEPTEWKDKQGNFWVFGGQNPSYSDMWRYNPVTTEWTWIKGDGGNDEAPVYGTQGVAASANTPGTRAHCAASWVDTSGIFWLFGGNNTYNNGTLIKNDLWKYNPGTNEWTWMAGDTTNNVPGVHGIQGVASTSTVPGARGETCSAWTDSSNNLWLFGGGGYDDNGVFGTLNDLMKYDMTTNEWTWMKGSAFSGAPTNYGIKGIANAANDPGSEWSYVKWKDLNGNFWVMGGGTVLGGFFGPDSQFIDLWKYNISLNEWTWMSGSAIPNDTGNYNNPCEFDSLSHPRHRYEQRSSVTDNGGRFWLFAGLTGGEMNDLWVFDPQKLKWNLINAGGNSSYGTLGVSSPSNMPPTRGGADAWWGNDNKFYMFGGNSISNIFPLTYCDVWVFNPDTSCLPEAVLPPVADFQTSNTSFCANSCINFTNLSTNATSWQWSFAGASDSISTVQNPQSVCYAAPGVYNVTLIASNAGGSDSVTFTNYIQVKVAPPTPVITQVGTILYCSTDTSYKSYQWYDSTAIIPGATDTFLVITHSGNYNVRVTNEDSCQVAVGITVIIGIQNYVNGNAISLSPNPAGGELRIKNGELRIKTIEIYNMLGQKIFSQQPTSINHKSETTIDVSMLPSGIYFVQLGTEGGSWVGRFIKE